MNQLRKSYSLSDLTDPNLDRGDGRDETDVVITDPRLLRRRRQSPSRSASTTTASALYFSEVDLRASDHISHVRSVEDISSGYSSSEGMYAAGGQPPKLQAREGLVRAGSLSRSRTTRVTRSTVVPRKSTASDVSTFEDSLKFHNF